MRHSCTTAVLHTTLRLLPLLGAASIVGCSDDSPNGTGSAGVSGDAGDTDGSIPAVPSSTNAESTSLPVDSDVSLRSDNSALSSTTATSAPDTESTGDESSAPQLDGPCEDVGRRACNGAGQDQLLICSQGRWTPNGACSSGERCRQESGTCAAVPEACAGQTASTNYCDTNTRMTCGADLVGVVLGTCSDGCSVVDGQAVCDSGSTDSTSATSDANSTTPKPTSSMGGPWTGDGGVSVSTFADGGEVSVDASTVEPHESDASPSTSDASSEEPNESDASPSTSDESLETTLGETFDPPPVVIDPNNLLTNASFESGVGEWLPMGGATLQDNTTTSHTGAHSLLCGGRTQNWEGPALEVLPLVEPGQSYVASGWVRSANANGTTFHVVRKAVCISDAGVAETDQSQIYQQLGATYTDDSWTQLVTAPFTVPECELSTFVIYFEGPAAGQAFYLDDVSLVPAP